MIEGPTKDLADWSFVVLGLINGASALAIGATGATAVRAMRGVDEQTGKAIALPFVVASAIALVWLTFSPDLVVAPHDRGQSHGSASFDL
jgi:hypothetical protein